MNYTRKMQQVQDQLEGAASQLDRLGHGPSETDKRFDRVFDVITNFDQASSLLYRLRDNLDPGDPVLGRSEDFMAGFSAKLLGLGAKRESTTGYLEWYERYQLIWRENFALFGIVAITFIATCIIGWNIGTTHPGLTGVLVSQEMMETILEKNSWFASLNEDPLLGGVQIAWNNIMVSVNCFLGGALFGVGGLILLGFNGLSFGSIMGYCYLNGFDRPLTEFVLAHGPLELTIIVFAVFASLLYGKAFFAWPFSGFRQRISAGGRLAGTVIVGVLPWLILAGAVESFVSPNPNIPLIWKAAVGGLIAVMFWVYTLVPARYFYALKLDRKS